jgi:DNA modification methylase
LLCGNAEDPKAAAHLLGALRPSLMVTDPPYGVEYDPAWRARAGVNRNKKKLGRSQNDDRSDWREAWQLFPGDVAYVWHASLFTSNVLASLEAAGFEHRAMIIWANDRFTLGRGHYQWQHEPAWYVVRKGKTGHWCGDRAQSTVWNIKAREDGGHGHGMQKPVECMRRPIQNHTNPGQCVYDPFAGSGTTIIAAETIGRVALAIDIDPAYVDVAVERWQNFTGRKATLESDGRTFDEVKAERVAPAPELADLAADLEVVGEGA